MCDYGCSLKRTLRQHIASVHEGKKPHKCSICDYSFSEKGNMIKHIESVHEERNSNKCSIWDCSCSTKANLKLHTYEISSWGKLITQVHNLLFRC